MTDRPDVDTLVERIEYALKHLVGPAGPDGKVFIGDQLVPNGRAYLPALSDLAARARETERNSYGYRLLAAEADRDAAFAREARWSERIQAAEADRDRATEKRNEALDDRNRLARRVTELEAALRAIERNDPAALSLARAALAGDGGGA